MPPIDKTKALAEFGEGKALGSRVRAPHTRWGFRKLPFQKQFVYEMDSLFIDSQVYEFLRWTGSFLSQDTNNIESSVSEQLALLVGPEGIGKTTLVRKLVSELGKEIKAKYLRIRDQNDKLDEKLHDYELSIGLTGFEGSIRRKDLTDTQILFLDNADALCEDIPRISNEISQNIETDHITILVISPSTYRWLEMNIPLVSDLEMYNLRLLNNDEIVDLLQRRIDYFQDSGFPQPFSKSALERIADYSMGFPGLALELAGSCLKSDIDVITEERVVEKAKERNFDIAMKIAEGNEEYWEGSRGEILKKLTISLSPIEQQKLKKLRVKVAKNTRTQEELRKQEGTSSAELVERISLSSQGTTSYHLKKLIEISVVQQIKIGRNQLYTIQSPIRNAVELALMTSAMLR